MASFTASVFQNEFLADGATEAHAVVSVTCTGAGKAGAGGGSVAEVLVIDRSGSMDMPPAKLAAAKRAAVVALDEILDGTKFAVIAGNNEAEMIYPGQPTLAVMSERTRNEAKDAVRVVRTAGSTAIGRWLLATLGLLQESGTDQRHCILLTDGKIEGEEPHVLGQALDLCEGQFQCDARGIGTDWVVDELRRVSSRLMGSVDIVAQPGDLEADFEAMMKTSMSRGVADARLRLWTPQGAEVLFVRQVAPVVADLTDRAMRISDQIVEFPTGAWSDESRDFHVAVRVPVAPVGSERLAARAELVINDVVQAKAMVRAIWSGDVEATTRIDPAVAHYTGQTELAAAIQEGLAAKAAGNDGAATTLLGKAAKLANDTGNEDTMRLLKKVVDVDDAGAGTVRLKRTIDKADEMALDTRSTKTTRIRREPAPIEPTSNDPTTPAVQP
jgi:von Willebrand factor type A C-terminal domain/von Willebrand factor type A domain